jgi:protein gp37
MSDTPIEWTDVTWNPVRGCARVSPGCEHCYAERVAHRFSGPGGKYEGLTVLGKKGPRWSGAARFVPEKLGEPLSWRKGRRVFVNSMSDLFHADVSNEQIAAVFGVMAACPQHTFQILTKRPERMLEWFGWIVEQLPSCHTYGAARGVRWYAADEPVLRDRVRVSYYGTPDLWRWPLPNVWLGVSCEDQQRADERILLLLQCPAAVRFVSAEPLLGPIDFGTEWLASKLGRYPFPNLEPEHRTRSIHLLDWIIVGGESGHGARPCHVDWIRSIVEQCKGAEVACFVKQLGAVPATMIEPTGRMREHGGKTQMQLAVQRMLLRDRKGGDVAEWPHDLRDKRQFPEVHNAG